MSFHLTRDRRQQLLDADGSKGNPYPRHFIFKPLPFGCEPGAVYVFARRPESRHVDRKTKQVVIVPAEDLAWITVKKATRRVDGWLVTFDVTDNRHQALMLARGGGYTTDPRLAIDRDEAELTPEDRRRFAVEARAARAEQQTQSPEAQRQQERAIRSRLREAMQGLGPVAQATLLAKIARVIEDATEGEREAA